MDIGKLDQAKELATKTHAKQMYGEKPYMFHISAVVLKLAEHFPLDTHENLNIIIAGYCHDLIEDCGVTKENLEEKFGKDVADMVDAVSGVGDSRKERKLSMLRKLEACPCAINVKLADRLCNMRQARVDSNVKLVNMYLSEVSDYDSIFKLGAKKLYDEFSNEVEKCKSFKNRLLKP